MPYFMFTWVLGLAVRTLFIVAGWFVVPLAAACKAYEEKMDQDGVGNPRVEYHFTWKWMFPWDNFEDGIANDTYVKYDSMFMKIVYWSAIRNPANNLRIVPYLSLDIDPAKVKWTGGPHGLPTSYDLKPPAKEWFIAWCGLYSGIWIQRTFLPSWVPLIGGFRRFWLGWKIFPSDVYGVTGHRVHGAGFATQYKRLG